jgi:hypothetical protein
MNRLGNQCGNCAVWQLRSVALRRALRIARGQWLACRGLWALVCTRSRELPKAPNRRRYPPPRRRAPVCPWRAGALTVGGPRRVRAARGATLQVAMVARHSPHWGAALGPRARRPVSDFRRLRLRLSARTAIDPTSNTVRTSDRLFNDEPECVLSRAPMSGGASTRSVRRTT